MCVKVAQLCLTLCSPMDYTVQRIFQAWILEWIAFPLSRGSSKPRDRTQVSHTAGRFFTSWATREPLGENCSRREGRGHHESERVSLISHVRLFVTPWTVTCQASLSLEFSRQEYWSGLSFPSPGDLLDSGIKPKSSCIVGDPLPSEPQWSPGYPTYCQK